MASRPDFSPPPELNTTKDERRTIIHRSLDRHYRDTLDQPVPILGNKSPRAAAKPKDIDLDAIAWTRGAVVNYRPIDNCEATIVGSKRRAIISVNSRSMPERRRFSLAHELGHWHHHHGRVLFCGKNDVCNFANDALNPERQADGFASDLILPTYMVDPRLRKMKRLTLVAARELADEFGASLTATLFKMTILNRFPMMIVCHNKIKRRWFEPSPMIQP
jgi:Zn-dependent peptidase ImmA (M78 family)